jgi:hypothetical protein
MNTTLKEIAEYVESKFADQTEEFRREVMTRAFHNFKKGAGTLENALALAAEATQQKLRLGQSRFGRNARPRGY